MPRKMSVHAWMIVVVYLFTQAISASESTEVLFIIDDQLVSGNNCALAWKHDKAVNDLTCCLVNTWAQNTTQKAYEVIAGCLWKNEKSLQQNADNHLIRELATKIGLPLLEITQSNEPKLKEFFDTLTKKTLLIKTEDAHDITLDYNGNFTPDSLKTFLAKAYNDGLIKNADFKDVSCISSQDLMQNKGSFTLQLFNVQSQCSPSKTEYIVKEMSLGAKEAFNLAKAAYQEKLKPYSAPQKQIGFPVFIFPFAYISYKDRQNKIHYLSIMHKALGKPLGTYVLEYGKNQSAQNELDLKKALELTGSALARFYRTFMQPKTPEKVLQPTIVHNDLHYFNILVDIPTDTVSLIDDERVIQSIEGTGSVLKELKYFYDIAFLTLFTQHYTRMIDVFGPLKPEIKNKVIYMLVYNFLKGFLQGISPTKETRLKVVAELKQALYNAFPHYTVPVHQAFDDLEASFKSA